MHDNAILPATRDERLDAVIVDYLREVAAGRAPDRTELLERHPDLAADLSQFFADQDQVAKLATPLRRLTLSAPADAVRSAHGVSGAPAAGRTVGANGSFLLGDYEILEEIGRGGMGIVYRARQKALGRLVAVKMMAASAWGDEAALARFRTEALAAARLQHPNVVQIFEVAENEGRPYLVLELVEGGNLAEHLNGTPVPAVQAAALVETLARAVHVAHQHGIVHRDLKPANVLLAFSREPPASADSPPGTTSALAGGSRLNEATPKITDFGLAKTLEGGPGALAAGGLTSTGAILGTPSYMAPEQADGRNRQVGPAADVYALGAVLYELLTGRPPFRGVTRLDTLHQVLRDEPVPPRRLQPRLPRDLETVCLKCLEKDPAGRYPTALDLAGELHRFLCGEPVRARPVGAVGRLWRWGRRQPVVAGLGTAFVTVLVIGAALLFWQWRRAEENYRTAEGLRREAVEHLERAEASFRLAHDVVNDFTTRFGDRGLLESHGLEPLRKEMLGKARAYYQEFLEQHGQDPALRRELAETSGRLARVTADVGSHEEAVKLYRHALELYEDLLRTDAEDFPVRTRRAVLHNDLGIVLDTLGRRDEALTSFSRSQALLKDLLRERPENLELQNELASTYNNQGIIYADTKRPGQALAAYEQARTIHERLARAKPENPEFTGRLSNTLNNMGLLLRRNGREREAPELLQKAVEIRERLARRFPDRPTIQGVLAESLINLGETFRKLRRTDEAVQTLDRGRGVARGLAKTNPRVVRYRALLGSGCMNIGLAHLDAGAPDKALPAFDEGRKVYEQLAGEHPDVPDYLKNLGALNFQMGGVFSRLKREDLALRAYEQGRDAEARLAAAYPDKPDYPSQLAVTLHNLAVTLGRLGRDDEARTTLLEAVARQRTALAKAPGDATYRRKLANHYVLLARLERDTGRLDESAAATENRLALWPDDPKELYDGARELALTATAASKLADRLPKEQARRQRPYADLALTALRRAIAAGFHDLERVRTDPALAPLRARPDFQTLWSENGAPTRPNVENPTP